MRLESTFGGVYPIIPSAASLAKSAAVMAVTYLAIEAFNQLTVEAGPISYAACVAACVPTALAGPAAAICIAACAPLALPFCP